MMISLIHLCWLQAVEKELGEMLGVPAKIIQPGSRTTPGGDPMTISLPMAGATGLGMVQIPPAHGALLLGGVSGSLTDCSWILRASLKD